MHPLFISHLIGDYLLQPTWLVKYKFRGIHGIILHSLIHAGVMFAMMGSRSIYVILIVLAIATLHGFLDNLKAEYHRQAGTFGMGLIIDQVAHMLILFGAFILLPYTPTFWITNNGVLIASILLGSSYIIANINLLRVPKPKLKTWRDYLVRMLLILVIFSLFVVPAFLLPASADAFL